MAYIVVKILKGGIAVDVDIIKRFIPDAHVIIDKDLPKIITEKRPKPDKLIFIEHIPDKIPLELAKTQMIWIPNQEFVYDWDIKQMIKWEPQILCKTLLAKSLFTSLVRVCKSKVIYMGFSSIITPMSFRRDYNLISHIAGSSFLKGTGQLLKCWILNGGFLNVRPGVRLVIVKNKHILDTALDRQLFEYKNKFVWTKSNDFPFASVKYKNIYWVESLDKKDVSTLQHFSAINVAPSLTEGFGHCINEALLSGQIVITSNHPPMNEHVKEPSLLVDVDVVESKSLIPLNYLEDIGNTAGIVLVSKLAECIHNLLDKSNEYLSKLAITCTQTARKRDAEFSERAARLFGKAKVSAPVVGGSIKTEKYIVKNEFGDKKIASFMFTVFANDMYIRKELKEGYLIDPEIPLFLKFCNLPADSIAVDVGANIGTMTVPFATMFSKVYSYEPFKPIFQLLQTNVADNKLTNVIIANKAVGHENGFVNIANTVQDRDFHTGEIIVQELVVGGNVEINYGAVQVVTSKDSKSAIPMTTLDDDLVLAGNIALIKVDVEGSEPLVFYGAQEIIKKYKPIIVFETNFQKCTLNAPEHIKSFDIVKFCIKHGYKGMVYMNKTNIVLYPPWLQIKENKVFSIEKTNQSKFAKWRMTRPIWKNL